jgi:ribonuclease BN (tRNA processing enzyme)
MIFLGTGDPLNWERAQTSLAVLLEGDEVMLIDASSGTVLLGQLEAAGIPLQSVRYLFVSHTHFDHVGGLAPLLVGMAPLPEASLTVYASPGTLEALREVLALTIPGVESWLGERLVWRELALGEAVGVNNAEITPFGVDHTLGCVGFRVALEGSTMVFAADTRPCLEVVENARETELLIHEAYGAANEAERAHVLGHSAASEAGGVARAAGAKRLVLTHFRASRFTDIKELVDEAAAAFGGPVDVAHDLNTFDF